MAVLPSGRSHHYANTPMQYIALFHGCNNVNFQMIFFSNFCSKHCLWGSNEYPQSMFSHNLCFGEKIRRKYTPVNPSFTMYKNRV